MKVGSKMIRFDMHDLNERCGNAKHPGPSSIHRLTGTAGSSRRPDGCRNWDEGAGGRCSLHHKA